MRTAMQELRDDLVATLKTGDEALNEIQDISIRESCQKVVQLTLESIIKRIDEELLEMEKEQREKDFIAGYKKRAELSNLIFDEASELSAKELFKQQEQ